ncbi:MAG: histone deacetylase family protein [Pseudomonadota bacterium]
MPPGHPERAERMAAVERALAAPKLAGLTVRGASEAGYEALARAHPSAFLDRVSSVVPANGMVSLDPDTHMGPNSWSAARRASGAVMAAVDAVCAREAQNAFVASRPPGHHAERTRAMGFCLVNHIAVAARHAQAQHGVGRVAIVDFDVHHGNGTQDIFFEDESVLYISTHQSPLYPGTGSRLETGVGNIVNLPLGAGTDGARYRPLFDEVVIRALNQFGPELLLLSAGFDAHVDDPLASMALTEDDFVWITRRMMEMAATHCDGRLVSLLEGGYHLGALERCVAAHVGALCEG